MPETEQTKVCPLCAETIKAAANVCPYCRKSQRRGAHLTPYDLCAIMILVLLLGTMLVIKRNLPHGRDFGSDKNKVLVTSFHIAPGKNVIGTNLVMVGIVTNGSGNSWRIKGFQVRFFDKNGKLLDFEDPILAAFTILPNSDQAFHLDLYSVKSAPNFATCTVQVASADDPGSSTER